MPVLTRSRSLPPRMPRMGPTGERYRVPRGLHERKTNFMEVFQISWLKAVAAASGAVVWRSEIIDDGIDAMLEHHHASHTSVPEQRAVLRLQLKSTTTPPVDGLIKVKVSRQRLREYAIPNPHIPTIVGVLSMPSVQEHWVYAGHRALSMFGRCAWVNLAGITVPDGDPGDKLVVTASLRQQFDDVAIAQMMERIGKGGQP